MEVRRSGRKRKAQSQLQESDDCSSSDVQDPGDVIAREMQVSYNLGSSIHSLSTGVIYCLQVPEERVHEAGMLLDLTVEALTCCCRRSTSSRATLPYGRFLNGLRHGLQFGTCCCDDGGIGRRSG